MSDISLVVSKREFKIIIRALAGEFADTRSNAVQNVAISLEEQEEEQA